MQNAECRMKTVVFSIPHSDFFIGLGYTEPCDAGEDNLPFLFDPFRFLCFSSSSSRRLATTKKKNTLPPPRITERTTDSTIHFFLPPLVFSEPAPESVVPACAVPSSADSGLARRLFGSVGL